MVMILRMTIMIIITYRDVGKVYDNDCHNYPMKAMIEYLSKPKYKKINVVFSLCHPSVFKFVLNLLTRKGVDCFSF